MNRKERRSAAKNSKKNKAPEWHNLTKEQRMANLVKNGITPKDLEENFKKGYAAAANSLGGYFQRQLYSAFALALHELHGFGRKRALEVLVKTRQIILDYPACGDIMERVEKEMGLEINVSESLEDDDGFAVDGIDGID